MEIVRRTVEKVEGYRTSDGSVYTSEAEAASVQKELDIRASVKLIIACEPEINTTRGDDVVTLMFIVKYADELRQALGPCECAEMRGRKYEKKLYTWGGNGDSPWPGEKITEKKKSFL